MKLAYTTSAIRTLKKLPPAERSRIIAKIEAYASAPENLPKVKSLTDRDGYRLRVGDMRVIFMLDEDTLTVTAVGHRRDIYD